jgi:hypothetical protein
MYGSFFNTVMNNTAPAEPEVGMGATLLLWSDRHAGTIVAVNGKTLKWQRDRAIRTDDHGMSDAQGYRYEPNPQAEVETYTLRKNGRWVKAGTPMKGGLTLLVGARHEYYDFSF